MRRLFKIYLDKPELAGVVAAGRCSTIVFEFSLERRLPVVREHARRSRPPARDGPRRDGRHDPDDRRRVRHFGRFGLRARADGHGDLAGRRRSRSPRPMLFGLAAAGGIGFVNGFVTLRFAIPSFITTLGMLFVVALAHGRDFGRLSAAAAARHPRPTSSPSSSASSGCRCSGSPASPSCSPRSCR